MYTIHEVCEKTGLSAHTLRYYEKEGLLSNVGRSGGGFRQYSEANIETLGLICCLKHTGMSLQDIARFMAMTKEGDTTLRARCELLEKHKHAVLERMQEMQRHLDKVSHKVRIYADRLEEYERRQND